MSAFSEIDKDNYIYCRNAMLQAARELAQKADDKIDDELFEGRDYDGNRLWWRGLHSLMNDIIAVLEVSTFKEKTK